MRDDAEIALEEFKVLRGEIAQRSMAQQSLIQLNLTGGAAVVGVFLTPFLDGRVLLLIPVISASLGLLWLDHARAIDRQGRFIRDVISPFLSDRTAATLPCYEDYVRKPGKDRRGVYNFALSAGVFALFFVFPAMALVAPFLMAQLDAMKADLLWLAAPGLATLLLFAIDYARWMGPQTGRQPSASADLHS